MPKFGGYEVLRDGERRFHEAPRGTEGRVRWHGEELATVTSGGILLVSWERVATIPHPGAVEVVAVDEKALAVVTKAGDLHHVDLVSRTKGEAPRELLRVPDARGFIVGPPRDGRVEAIRDATILVLRLDGICRVGSDGRASAPILGVPPESIEDWEVSGLKVLVRVATTPDRKDPTHLVHRGTYLLHLDRGEAEPIDSALNVHTIWFSPDGKKIVWGGGSTVKVRGVERSEKRGDAGGRSRPADVDDAEVVTKRFSAPVTGCVFDEASRRVVVCSGREVLVFDPSDAHGLPLRIRWFDGPPGSFVGEPHFLGDEVLVTFFRNETRRR